MCSYPLNNVFPRTIPNVTFHYDRAIPSETSDWLKSVGYTEARIKGKSTMTIVNPTIDVVRRLIGTGPSMITPTATESVNLQCMGPISLVQRVFSNFLRAHYYPAFISIDHASTVPDFASEEGGSGSKRKRVAGPDDAEGSSSGRQRLEGDADEEMEQEGPQVTFQATKKTTIRFAIPPPKDTIGWGGPSDIPTCAGLYIPFIHDLVKPDSKTVPDVLVKYFSPCLGTSVETVKSSVESVRSAWGIVAETLVGHELSHMGKCIAFAIEAQSRAFAIFDSDRYEGMVISGAGYTAVVERETFVPVEPAVLSTRVLEFSTHGSAARAIAQLAGVPVEDLFTPKVPGTDRRVQVTSMSTLAGILQTIAITEANKDEIKKQAAYLRFGSVWRFNSSSIGEALSLLKIPLNEIDNLPIHPSYMFSRDVVELVWSCFGRFAPSPIYPNSPKVDLTKGQRPTRIAFHQVPVDIAIGHMKEIAIHKEVTVPQGRRRSAAYKDIIFEGVEAKNLFAALTLFAVGVEVVPTSSHTRGNVSEASASLFEV